MFKRLLILLSLSSILLFFVQNSRARVELSVDEAATVITFKELAPELSLATFNGTGKPLDASVRVEFINTDDQVVTKFSQDVTINPGRNKLSLTLPLRTRDFSPNENGRILWYRLRYVITPLHSNQVEPVNGLISISEITPELFELRVENSEYARKGMRFRALVTTLHPVTRKPVQGVDIKGLLKLDEGDHNRSLTASSTTNDNGFAYLDFNLPRDINGSDIELVVDATRGLLAADASHDIDVIDPLTFIVSTDKPLYQPGQTIFTRVLMVNGARRVIPHLPVTLEIEDQDNQVLFRADLKTSNFGIAKAEWSIPESVKLGDYELRFKTEGENSHSAKVRVSRYDLPTFAVKVASDHDYYAPGQNATVTVKADYLFGKPVTRGHVKVVRETRRDWNYYQQRYEIDEGDKYEGEVGKDGSFKTQINLASDHESLDGSSDDYSNVSYTAYVTDASSSRTEQRRFDLRITKQPIHLYVIRPEDSYRVDQRWPLQFYVSTFYADGTPAICNIEAFSSEGDSEEKRTALGSVRTNKYGLARIDTWRLPELKNRYSYWNVSLVATDKDGKVGRKRETFQEDRRRDISLTIAKTIFAPGEAIAARVVVTDANALVTIGVVRNGMLVHSQLVRPSSKNFTVDIPYSAEFKGELMVVASTPKGSENTEAATRTILFPQNQALQLKVDAGSQTYLPGEKASVKFQTVNAFGREVESALGVVVVDPAVQERFSTDVLYGWSYSQFTDEALSVAGLRQGIGPFTRQSLDLLDPAKGIAPEVDLIAEILLNNRPGYTSSASASEYASDLSWVFSKMLTASLQPLRSGLDAIYQKQEVYPASEASLRQLLSGSGIDFDSFRDPWGSKYRPQFYVEGPQDMLAIRSAGPDKRFDTPDDFSATTMGWKYFISTGREIERAFAEYHKRTGGFIVDYEMLRQELRRSNIDLDQLRDRWGHRYKFNFDLTGKYFTLRISAVSPTPVQTFYPYRNGEFEVWRQQTAYFADYEAKIDLALVRNSLENRQVPTNVSELEQVLKAAGIELAGIVDPWGTTYYQTISITTFYEDKTVVTTNGSEPSKRDETKPFTRKMATVNFVSAGPDRTRANPDDRIVATFYTLVLDQKEIEANKPKVTTTATGYSTVIQGTVLDPNGAVIPGAKIKVIRNGSGDLLELESNQEGKFAFRNLEPGVYEVLVEALGFKTLIVPSIVVRSATTTELDVVLRVGEVTEMVTVSSLNSSLMTEISDPTTSIVAYKETYEASPVRTKQQQLSTPRVRGYFPETLLWQPELSTDKRGRAQLDFKLADNITTWKMSVIGSTADGELGVAEADIRTFQPFFAELDPPRVLTEGDQISLPIVLRNYLDRKQRVELELKPESWFSVSGRGKQSVDVPAGDSITPTFELKATASISDGKQRATAIGSEYSDAIEKPVTVHPDGEQLADTKSDLLTSTAAVEINLPANVITGSARTELKVYLNLMGHVWESVEGIMQRPHGCAEQTISSTYPSLLVARYLKKEDQDTPLGRRARGYLEIGYQRLLTYQQSNGSFAYWRNDGSDVALTAYAVRFLSDASTVLDVNADVMARAADWLIKQQQVDGRWRSLSWTNKEDPLGSTRLTALVARSLALQLRGKSLTDPSIADLRKSLKSALDYLELINKETAEPYFLASYALAAAWAGESEKAEAIAVRLQEIARAERNVVYWSLEGSTPFYGWGSTGQIETTALVVNALASIKSEDQKRRDLLSRGLQFLLKSKDRYGCWYSTQSTINVLDALLSLLGQRSDAGDAGSEVQVLVNGVQRESLTIPNKASVPLRVDLSRFVQEGSNRIELRRVGDGPVASLQVVSTYYVPWQVRENKGNVKLQAQFDRTEAKVSEEITCRIKVERVGTSYGGMLVAEIGLPPGVDVDRSSLETAKASLGWEIGSYEVLPDRVVVYLSPYAGRLEFSFKFKPRMAMTAKSAASTIYDYYNPEASAVVAPTTFTVR